MKSEVKIEIEQLKKRANKGAFRCPYCDETLILKSGDIREEHFAHRHSKSCEIAAASEVYHQQVKRESKKHSVIKDIIYDELKVQEKLKEDFVVGYGFVTKANEKWRYYPDIIVRNKEKELAITILTNVTSTTDEKLVKQLKKRNNYFNNKGLVPIWFIENTEQSIDMDNRVIHLWEAELNLAMKTSEDVTWEETLQELPCEQSVFELFGYHHRKVPISYDVRSLYYVLSTDTKIVFTVQRFIKDEELYPFRAFVLNKGYQVSLSTALLATQTLQLSNPEVEHQQRNAFVQAVKQKEKEYLVRQQEIQKEQERKVKALVYAEKTVSVRNEPIVIQKRKSIYEHQKVRKTIAPKESDLHYSILEYIKKFKTVSANELTHFLVSKGAPSECFTTGRYKIYVDVCAFLDFLITEGKVELLKKDFVNDRIYTVHHKY